MSTEAGELDPVDDVVVPGAIARIGIGALMLALPRLMATSWIGREGTQPAVKPLMRALGARDALLGVGLLVAAQERRGVRRWVKLGIAADAFDAIATLLAAKHLPKASVVWTVAVAGGAAATGVWVLQRLEPR